MPGDDYLAASHNPPPHSREAEPATSMIPHVHTPKNELLVFMFRIFALKGN